MANSINGSDIAPTAIKNRKPLLKLIAGMVESESVSLGYVVVPHPNTSKFRSIGQNHLVSFIPKTYFAEPLENTTICIWLGASDAGNSEVFVYLIWPGKGLLDFAPGLNTSHSSRIINLSDHFTLIPPTAIAQDLMLLGDNPCLLFVRWRLEPNVVVNEALSLCLSTRATNFLSSLTKYLESVAVEGDAVSSSRISDWYLATGCTLKKAARNDYLFDPTCLVKGIAMDLLSTLQQINKLDAISKPILIPLCFVRTWALDLAKKIEQDVTTITAYVKLVI